MSENFFRFEVDPRREVFVRLIGNVHAALARAVEDAAEEGVTKAEIARRLGVNKSVITRRLSGRANLTLKVLADMAWALGSEPKFLLKRRREARESNHMQYVSVGTPLTSSPDDAVSEVEFSGSPGTQRITVRALA